MNWLTNIRPKKKIRALVGPKKEIPDNLWEQCPGCSAMLFKRELEENLNVCRHCGVHLKMPPEMRIESLFDEGRYRVIDTPKAPADPLKFRDQKRYADRLKDAQHKTGRQDAIMVAEGSIGGVKTVAAVFDFAFMGGSMGVGVGQAIVAAAKRAVLSKSALIIFPSSGGARMQEGALSLMQLPRTIIAVDQVKAADLPYIVVLTDPTTGGVTASFAMVGDIHIAEKGAQIGFAGARVIESTIRETLPPGFQRAEYLLEHGMVDIVVERRQLRDTLVRVLRLLRKEPPLWQRQARRCSPARCRMARAAPKALNRITGPHARHPSSSNASAVAGPAATLPVSTSRCAPPILSFWQNSASRRIACRRFSMSRAPTAKVPPALSCGRCWKPPAIACMFILRRIWCVSMSVSASPANSSARMSCARCCWNAKSLRPKAASRCSRCSPPAPSPVSHVMPPITSSSKRGSAAGLMRPMWWRSRAPRSSRAFLTITANFLEPRSHKLRKRKPASCAGAPCFAAPQPDVESLVALRAAAHPWATPLYFGGWIGTSSRRQAASSFQRRPGQRRTSPPRAHRSPSAGERKPRHRGAARHRLHE